MYKKYPCENSAFKEFERARSTSNLDLSRNPLISKIFLLINGSLTKGAGITTGLQGTILLQQKKVNGFKQYFHNRYRKKPNPCLFNGVPVIDTIDLSLVRLFIRLGKSEKLITTAFGA
jgi:hypothetical protein